MDKRTFDEAEGVRAWAREAMSELKQIDQRMREGMRAWAREAMARRRAERRRMATRWVLAGLALAAGLVLRFLGAY